MEQSPSWEANRFSASQEIPRILWNPKVIADGFIIVIVTVIVIVISGLEADHSPSFVAEFKYERIYTFSFSYLPAWPRLCTNVYNFNIIIIIIIICIILFIYGIGTFRFNKQRDVTTEGKVSTLSWYLSLHPRDDYFFFGMRARVCVWTVSAAFVMDSNEAGPSAMSRTLFANQVTIHKIYGHVLLFRIV